MQVAHGSHTVDADLIPLERRGALIREHVLARLAAVLPETVLELSVLPAIHAAASRTAEASLPAF